jgi:hypothetical protein
MPTKANKKMMYYLGDTGCEDWNQALDDYLTCKRQNPQITWHNFYIARKEVVDSLDAIKETVKKEVDNIQDSGMFRA